VLTMNSPPVNSLGTSLVTSFKRFVLFYQLPPAWLAAVTPSLVSSRRRSCGMFGELLESRLRQEFPKLVQDPKARLGFAGHDGRFRASRQLKQ